MPILHQAQGMKPQFPRNSSLPQELLQDTLLVHHLGVLVLAGAKKTKLNAVEDECRKKKIKLNQDIVSASIKERQITYSKFVRTQEKSTTFRDAALGYRTFKDSDLAEAQKYKEIMLRCVINERTMDQEEEEVQEETDE